MKKNNPLNKQTANLLKKLYKIVDELEQLYPGRPFTPDGHLIGSIGECLIAEMFNLDLLPPSNKGFDAKDKSGRKIEIKITQGQSVGFRHQPEFAIVGQLKKTGQINIVYNGPGKQIWDKFKTRKLPSNGQYLIRLNKLIELDKQVKSKDRIN